MGFVFLIGIWLKPAEHYAAADEIEPVTLKQGIRSVAGVLCKMERYAANLWAYNMNNYTHYKQ